MIGEVDGIVKKQIGSQVYFLGTIWSDRIKESTFVPVIEPSKRTYLNENTYQGYQRHGSAMRMRSFMRFLKENPDSLVPPVILSLRDGWHFHHWHNDDRYGKLEIHSPGVIIDGQHRLGGYVALFEEDGDCRPIDFIGIPGLTREQEIKEFVTVNSTQRGVPKALTSFLGDEEYPRIAWALNEEYDSPFKGRITRTTMTRNVLFSLHSMAKQVSRTFNHGKLSDLNEDTKLDFMTRYWTIICDELREPWSDIEKLDDPTSRGRSDFDFKLLELTGLSAWSLMGPEILGRSYAESFGMNWDNVRKMVSACSKIDWRKDGQHQGRAGEQGSQFIKRDLERLLPPDQNVIVDGIEEQFKQIKTPFLDGSVGQEHGPGHNPSDDPLIV